MRKYLPTENLCRAFAVITLGTLTVVGLSGPADSAIIKRLYKLNSVSVTPCWQADPPSGTAGVIKGGSTRVRFDASCTEVTLPDTNPPENVHVSYTWYFARSPKVAQDPCNPLTCPPKFPTKPELNDSYFFKKYFMVSYGDSRCVLPSGVPDPTCENVAVSFDQNGTWVVGMRVELTYDQDSDDWSFFTPSSKKYPVYWSKYILKNLC